MSKEIKLIIFDHGGVMRVGSNETALLFASIGYSFDKFSSLGPSAEKAEYEFKRGLISEREFWKEVDKDLDHPTNFTEVFYKSKSSFPISGMRELVTELRKSGNRVVCGTNITEPLLKRNIDEDCYSCFDKLYASCTLKLAKPDVSFYEAILKAENVAKENALLIDDKASNTESAKSIGMQAIVFKNVYKLRKDLSELGLLVKKENA